MRASLTKNGITLRVIAGTYNAILGIDLEHEKRQDCLGFSIRRVDLGPDKNPFAADKREDRWLPNMLQFPDAPKSKAPLTTLTAPLQKFRWGDYTCKPGHRYRYQVVPRYGTPTKLTPSKITDADGVTVEVTMEDNTDLATYIYFNRGAAASEAFNQQFPKIKSESQLLADTDEAKAAKAWLSRGLEEALIAYLGRATDKSFALHGAVYEFQKAELLAALAAADKRGADVDFVYHHRKKGDKDTTASKNDKAVKAAKIQDLCTKRQANPQNAIMHDKFVVLLEKNGKDQKPIAVWTGSTNWTDGGIYGQLNVGHAIFDEKLAATYEGCFQILKQDLDAEDTKAEIEKLTPVSQIIPPAPGINPIFSPQTTETMLHLYSSICMRSRCVFVCAPFALSPVILSAFTAKPQEPVLRYFLLDKEGSLGKGQEVSVIENDPSNAIGVAVTLSSPLHDFQGHLLEGKESFRHAGVHVHSKIILADPFGTDPVLVMGSANFSHGSTEVNDSNSLVFRGNTAVADIYATEFMRMFEHYHFRASQEHALKKVKKAAKKGTKSTAAAKLALIEDDSCSEKYYVQGSHEELDRMMFAGTFH